MLRRTNQEMQKTQEINAKLRSKGLKVTPQRIAVYKALSELCHASVDDVMELVLKQNPTITVATVYNVLDCFAENGIVSRLNTPKGKLHYDISIDPHHHLITGDGTIIDYDNDGLTAVINDFIQNNPLPHFSIERVSVQLIGNKN